MSARFLVLADRQRLTQILMNVVSNAVTYNRDGSERGPMTAPENWDGLQHDLKNQLGIVVGFIELLIDDTPESDPRRADMLEIRRAAKACLALVDPAAPDQAAGLGTEA